MKIKKVALLLCGCLTASISENILASENSVPSDKNPSVSEEKGKASVKISKIVFIGCQRIDPKTIESYLPIQVGDEYDDYVANESLKLLYSTEFFEEVNLKINGSVLTVTVKEYPVVNEIAFEGNSKIKDNDVKNTIPIKPREVLSPSKVKEVQQGLLETYRKMGRYNATVSTKVIKLPNNRVNLVFEINEGISSGIEKINFVGNKSFSSEELRDVVSSKTKRWYRFFVTDDIYDQDRLTEDKMLLSRFYKERGYINCRILSGIGELSHDKKGFNLTFTIDEGERYKFDQVKVESSIKSLNAKDFEKDLYCKKGDVYNILLVEADLSDLTKKAGSKGIASVKVTPKVTLNNEKNTIGITYTLSEGEKIYISKIVIKGNTRTRDKVIRREIPIEEGDAYNSSLIKAAENNIRGTGFFKNVNVETIPDPNYPDKCVVQISVEEQPTGEAMASASYSTTDKFGIELSYNERNFFGTGKTFGFSIGSGNTRTGSSYIEKYKQEKKDKKLKEEKVKRKNRFKFFNNVNVFVTDPHLLDKDIEGSVSLFKYNSGRWDGFSTKEHGTTLGISYELSQKFQQGFEYTAINRKFHDMQKVSSPIIKYQVLKHNKDGSIDKNGKLGNNVLSSIRHSIDFRTSFLTGLKGTFITGLSTTYAGIGGDARHLKNVLSGSYIFPIYKKTTLKLSASYGIMSKIGNKRLGIMDSYSLGLDSFRGFDDCGFGPMAKTTRLGPNNKPFTVKDYIGATKYWKGTIELTFPLGLPEELQFRGFVFTDFGTAWGAPDKGKTFLYEENNVTKCTFDSNVTDHKIVDTKKIRSSIGCGVSFITPFGPLKLTYAMPVRKNKEDEQQRILLGFTTTF